jgi:hypothetical protein
MMICYPSSSKRIWSPLMDKRTQNKGQSLVEFSLVFPAVLFTVILMLEIFFIVYAKIALGFTADRIARAAAAQGNPRVVELSEYRIHFTVGPSWGMPLRAGLKKDNLPQWPPYSGLAIKKPLDRGGSLSVVDMKFKVFPKVWFGNLIHIPNLGAHVELPTEPAVPQS